MGQTKYKLETRLISSISSNSSLIVLTLVYIFTFLLMLPLRNMAFEDDFSYIQSTEHLVTTGQLKMSEFIGVATVFQTLWGAVFAKVLGFSIGILHLSNVVLLYFGLVAFYFTLKRLQIGQWRACLFTILLLSFPWVFQFTYSYMTDVFYMSLFMISSYFYILAFQTNKKYAYILGSTFAGLAYIQRQNAIVIPSAIILVFIFKYISSKRLFWQQLIYSIFPFGVIAACYFWWISITGLTICQVKLVLEPLQNELLPKLVPHDLRRSIGISQQYYLLALVKRGLAYFDNTIAFLTPVFLIYKFNLKGLFQLFKENWQIILITTGAISIAYFVDFKNGSAYTSHIPGLITRYESSFTEDWRLWWPRLVWISRVFWVVVIAITIKKVLNNLFEKRDVKYFKLFRKIVKILSLIWLGVFLFYLRLNFPAIFDHKRILLALKSLTVDHNLIIALQSSWFVFTITFLSLILAVYILVTRRLKNDTNTLSLLFLGILLILSYLFNCFFARAWYEEYIIQFIPLVYFLLAYLFRKVPINAPLAVLITCFTLFFAISGTRERYQIEGVKWDLGTRLINQGINPYYTHVNWPWWPWWYYKNEFPKILAAYPNKYEIPPEKYAGWPRVEYTGINYRFDPLQVNSPAPVNTVIESKPFWLFDKGFVRLVGTTYTIKSLPDQ